MINKIKNILIFTYFLKQILDEYSRDIPSSMLSTTMDSYIREKSKILLGIEIGTNKIDIDKFRHQLIYSQVFDIFRELFDFSEVKSCIDLIDDDRISGIHPTLSKSIMGMVEKTPKTVITKQIRKYNLNKIL